MNAISRLKVHKESYVHCFRPFYITNVCAANTLHLSLSLWPLVWRRCSLCRPASDRDVLLVTSSFFVSFLRLRLNATARLTNCNKLLYFKKKGRPIFCLSELTVLVHILSINRPCSSHKGVRFENSMILVSAFALYVQLYTVLVYENRPLIQ